MKNFWIKIKPVLIFTFWLICGGTVIVLLGASIRMQSSSPFSAIKVNIDESIGNMFINEKDVLEMLKDNQVNINRAKPVSEINYRQIEHLIESNPYVESADIYTDANEKIQINIQQRMPLLRIINNQSVSYYLDSHGKRMPLSANFTARVPVATGYIFTNAVHQSNADTAIENKLFVLADFIRRDSFLASITEQIIINKESEIEIVTMIGNQLILIGNVDQLDQKFKQLKIFYKETIGHVNVSMYSKINLKYENQIYCTRRGEEVMATDSIATSIN